MGFKLGAVAALKSAEMFQSAGVKAYWQCTILVLGCLVVVCSVALAIFVRKPPAARLAAQRGADDRIAARLDLRGTPGRLAGGHRDLRGLHLDAGGPHLHGDAVRPAGVGGHRA